MTLSTRRIGIAIGALVEAGLIMWLLSGYLPAGLIAGVLTLVLGAAIYRDIVRRDVRRTK